MKAMPSAVKLCFYVNKNEPLNPFHQLLYPGQGCDRSGAYPRYTGRKSVHYSMFVHTYRLIHILFFWKVGEHLRTLRKPEWKDVFLLL